MKMQICGLCDASYDADDPREAAMHEHFEPQSGPLRTAWMASKMPWGFFEKSMTSLVSLSSCDSWRR